MQVAATVIRALTRLLHLSYRVRIVRGAERLEELPANHAPCILGYWHNRVQFFYAYLEQKLVKRGFRVAIITSLSKDGDLGTILGQRAGAYVARGSQGKSSLSGLRQLHRILASDKRSIVLNPDGSRGPIYRCKSGAVLLARMTGCEIVPMSFWADRAWRAKSWDRLIIPKPFARVAVVIGDPIRVPSGQCREELERYNQQLEAALIALGDEAAAAVGHPAAESTELRTAQA